MRRPRPLAVALLALPLAIGACGGGSYGGGGTTSGTSTAASASTVRSASNPTLGGTVLVDGRGLTLYSLSAEAPGRFICTGSCLTLWHPLLVKGGTSPTGTVGSLSTVKRPDGSQQVTYRGMPLYTFAQDTRPGQATGQGFHDVGTWGAVTVTAAAHSSTPAPASRGRYGY